MKLKNLINVFLAAILIVSCSEFGQDGGQIIEGDLGGINISLYSKNQLDSGRVASAQATVSGDDFDSITVDLDINYEENSINERIDDIPVGENRTLAITLFNDKSEVSGYGEVPGIKITKDTYITVKIDIYLYPETQEPETGGIIIEGEIIEEGEPEPVCENEECTEVGGVISSDTTWDLEHSPYVLTADVQIPGGVTLTIEPGVKLVYNKSDYEILIKGGIIVNGISSQPIVFTSSQAKVSSKATQIRFVDADLDLSQISYISMEWADKAIYTDSGNVGTLNITNLNLNNASITASVGSITISNSTITNATVNISNYNKSCASTLIVQDSATTDSTMSLDYGSCTNLTIERVAMTRTKVYTSPDVRSGTITKVLSSTMIDSSIRCGISATCEITQSDLSNTYIDARNSGQLTMTDSTLSFTGSYGIQCYDSMYPKKCSISSSNIIGNGSGIGIYMASGSISYTEIRDTSVAIKIGSYSPTISNNNFINSSSYCVENQSTSDIQATNNYWGTSNEETIKAKIFDYYDDINYGKVIYSPYSLCPTDDITLGCSE
jgi:hypothetical protein